MADMKKQDGAFLTIGELAAELGVPQHILRYWETRFPALRPLQRAGNRRYYRPEDVELAHAIHRLLNVEGYTVRGAQQALTGKGSPAKLAPVEGQGTDSALSETKDDPEIQQLLEQLKEIRATLQEVLAPSA